MDLAPTFQFGDPIPQAASPDTLRFLARRRSASALALAAPGPDAEQLSALLQLAGRVPDHGKLAPWRFVVLEGAGKAKFAAALEALAEGRSDTQAAAKLGKLKVPPVCVAVVASPKAAAIPEWEQLLSAGAVCTTLLYASLAMGFGANWITDWYAYDPQAKQILGLAPQEQVAGYVMIGTAAEPPLERERPPLQGLVTRWS
jgi:nitroreductase